MPTLDDAEEHLVAGAEPLMRVPPLLSGPRPRGHFEGMCAIGARFSEMQIFVFPVH